MRRKNKWKEKPAEILAPIATASFFGIAIANIFNGLLHLVRNDKKDTVESGTGFEKKRKSSCSKRKRTFEKMRFIFIRKFV